jgi:glutamine amidotransferase
MDESSCTVSIVDYGVGNLFSVQHACQSVGLKAEVTSSNSDIAKADAVILPGVGAFGDAMNMLHRLDLVSVLKDAVASGRPFIGICLGMQLLMSHSHEFGHHLGLGMFPGAVIGFADTLGTQPRIKIPQVGWNRMRRTSDQADAWSGTLLDGLPDGVFMHFVHSFYVQPEDVTLTIATTEYGGLHFCSALQWKNVFACQAHPERSGPFGLGVYRNLAAVLHRSRRIPL